MLGFHLSGMAKASIRKNSIRTCQLEFLLFAMRFPPARRKGDGNVEAHNYNLWNMELHLVKLRVSFFLFHANTKYFSTHKSESCRESKGEKTYEKLLSCDVFM